jgi:hypothetical protein
MLIKARATLYHRVGVPGNLLAVRRLTFESVVSDQLQDLANTNFEFYKRVTDDGAFAQSSVVTDELAAGGSDPCPPGRSLAVRSACIIGPGGTMVALIAILVVLWMLGIVTKNTLGGFLHILLVIAVIVLLIRVIRGRPV